MTAEPSHKTPVVLCILSGVGEGQLSEGNAVHKAKTPTLDKLRQNAAFTTLRVAPAVAPKPAILLPCGYSGHLRLGSGQTPHSARERIDEAIASEKLAQAPMLDQTMRIALYDKTPLHLIGLLSNTGIHASMDHLCTLIDYADFHEIPVMIHAIIDGRDTPRRSAMGFIEVVESRLEGKKGAIATLAGRDYAMDRSERWDRSYQSFHAIVRDKTLGPPAERAENAWEAISGAYARGEYDCAIEPIRLGNYDGLQGEFLCDFTASTPVWEWTGADVGLAFNHRGDGLRQLSALLSATGLPDEVRSDLLMDRHNPVRAFREHCFATLSDYGDEFELPVVMPSARTTATLSHAVSAAGLRQLRCTESEHASHLMRSFSGGHSRPLLNESRQLIPSPRLVDSYHEKPAMRSDKIAAAVTAALQEGVNELIVASFANVDEVAHCGDWDATVAAVAAVDRALGTIAEAAQKAGAHLVVTSSHGHAEAMIGDNGKVQPGHSSNPVPFVLAAASDEALVLRGDGCLEDVAPTILDLLGLPAPEAMVGRSLVNTNE
jgi:2,3-bisphosphoglycerate-independent phosphoglycerate mutase